MTEVARQVVPERMPLAEFLAWEEAQPLRCERSVVSPQGDVM